MLNPTLKDAGAIIEDSTLTYSSSTFFLTSKFSNYQI